MKRKKKNANGGNEADKAKKQGSCETDLLKKADKEQLTAYPMEEEKKVTPLFQFPAAYFFQLYLFPNFTPVLKF